MRYDSLTTVLLGMQRVVLGSASLFRFIKAPGKGTWLHHETDKTNDPFVFVHGFFGWGQNEVGNDTLAYWGMFSGNLIKKINRSGFTAVAPSVNPVGSAWDRACELYAQLTGTRVDYGKAHSARFGHARYGEDFTGRPILPQWDSSHKINLIGHSFGGPTATLLASILAYGAEEEIKATTDGSLSDFFKGGKTDWIRSITGLAAAFNGTTLPMAHQGLDDIGVFLNTERAEKHPAIPARLRRVPDMITTKLFDGMERIASGEIAAPDTGLFDMDLDESVRLNQRIQMLPDVYYFSIPHDATRTSDDGTHRVPDSAICDPFFVPFVYVMGHTNTVSKGGIALDERWRNNDGLVNTISETAPFDKPSKIVGAPPSVALAKAGFAKGVYHVFPTYPGAHMAFQGNVFRPSEKSLGQLFDLMLMINAL